MFRRYPTSCLLCAIPLLMVAGSTGCLAQPAAKAEPPAISANGAITPQLVKTGLFLFSSPSGNSLLRLTARGPIMVDGQHSEDYDTLRKKVRRISEDPIRLLIVTDHHEAHTGSNARFLADGAAILAQEHVTLNVKNYNSGRGAEGAPGIAPPTKTYDREFTVAVGGIEVRLMHFGNARTDGDSVVYFPNLRVVAVGDLLAAAPDPDCLAGGSLLGWGPVLGEILKLDFDVVVPGRGPMATRGDLEAFRDKVDAFVSRAAGLVKRGVAKDKLMGLLNRDESGSHWSLTNGQLDAFYAELSMAR